ncbi:hypothetical protein JCM10908_005584 [Rhodotorula pacifica]|uniref:uncharacterized protein n=1 Tax=Rhodotorula pacifica TaxID=1495444 RepID=UPI00317BF2E0
MDEGNASMPTWRTLAVGSFFTCFGCFVAILAVAFWRHHRRLARYTASEYQLSSSWNLPTVAELARVEGEDEPPSFTAATGEPQKWRTTQDVDQKRPSQNRYSSSNPASDPPEYGNLV